MRSAFCTYFDSGYLTRGLALWESLTAHVRDFELFVLCMDDAAYDALASLALPQLTPIRLAEIEADDRELLAAKPTRSRIEYYFTTSPALPLFLLRRDPSLERITYLDADLFFFDSLDAVWQELGDGSVGIIAHRFAPKNAHLGTYGTYNVGLVAFRNDARGRAVLEWWRDRCIEWCYDRVEPERFADQKYLDRWPSQFEGVVVLQHKGANVAPWNAGNYRFPFDGTRVLVDDEPLLFYHFHRLRHWRGALWQLGFSEYKTWPDKVLVEHVYRPYIATLARWQSRAPAVAAKPLRYRPRVTEFLRMPLFLATREMIIA